MQETVLDINGYKQAGNKDFTRLFQYLSDWNVKIFLKAVAKELLLFYQKVVECRGFNA